MAMAQSSKVPPIPSSAADAISRLGLSCHNLGTHSELTLDVNGSISDGTTTNALKINAYLKKEVVGSNLVTRFDARIFVNEVKVQQIVGDGSRLWQYDVAANSYRNAKYGTGEASSPINLSKALMGLTRGVTNQIAKVLLDCYDPKRQESWQPFQPLAQWKESTFQFEWNVGSQNEMMGYDTTYLVADTPSSEEVTRYGYTKSETVKGVVKTTNFTVDFTTGYIPNDPELGIFELKLPASARPVAIPKD